VLLSPRPIRIDSFVLRSFELPHFEFEVQSHRHRDNQYIPTPYLHFISQVYCGGGTYVRALAADIAIAVGSCGSVETLLRTEAGIEPLSSLFCLLSPLVFSLLLRLSSSYISSRSSFLTHFLPQEVSPYLTVSIGISSINPPRTT
jgi:hypothetical protein